MGLPTKIFVVVANAMDFFVEMAELFVTNVGKLNNFTTKKKTAIG